LITSTLDVNSMRRAESTGSDRPSIGERERRASRPLAIRSATILAGMVLDIRKIVARVLPKNIRAASETAWSLPTAKASPSWASAQSRAQSTGSSSRKMTRNRCRSAVCDAVVWISAAWWLTRAWFLAASSDSP
jgi:hypothetical protein